MKKWFACILCLWMTAGILLLNFHMQVSADFSSETKPTSTNGGLHLQQYAFSVQDDALFTGSGYFHYSFEGQDNQQLKRNALSDNYLRIVYAKLLNHNGFLSQQFTLSHKASLLHSEGYYLYHLRKLRI